jgi:hypothetical protein
MRFIHLSEALRMFRRSRYVRKHGFHKYSGDDVKIAEQIIDSCWNKEKQYFQVSSGHFNEFYCRDFGICAEALVKLGHKEKVIKTLDYALSRFKKHGSITTSISPSGKCFDFPYYAVDSLPFIIHAIRVSNAKDVLKRYKDFLVKELDNYYETVFDNSVRLVRNDRYFSSMKDYSKRESACYDNCVLSMLSDDLSEIKFYNPFSDYDIKRSILHNFWSGEYFYDDLSQQKIVTGDANVFPFWCGVIDSKHLFELCMASIEKARLAKPFPLKYTTKPERIHRMHLLEIFAGDYERDSIWAHLAMCFLDVVKKYDKKRFTTYMQQYRQLILKHRNFLEVYRRDGEPFHTRFYHADESLLWVAKYLSLKKY